MESLSMVIFVSSFVVYSWAVLGLIRPVSAGLPNRWASVPIWIGSVVLFIIGGSLGASRIEDGDNSPATSAGATTEVSDTACQEDLQCWGDRHNIAAAFECDDYVEELAKYSHRWTDGFLETKFPRFRWKNRSTGELTYIGDSIQFQNGFGAFEHYRYECDFDPWSETVLAVRARPGRLGSFN